MVGRLLERPIANSVPIKQSSRVVACFSIQMDPPSFHMLVVTDAGDRRRALASSNRQVIGDVKVVAFNS